MHRKRKYPEYDINASPIHKYKINHIKVSIQIDKTKNIFSFHSSYNWIWWFSFVAYTFTIFKNMKQQITMDKALPHNLFV